MAALANVLNGSNASNRTELDPSCGANAELASGSMSGGDLRCRCKAGFQVVEESGDGIDCNTLAGRAAGGGKCDCAACGHYITTDTTSFADQLADKICCGYSLS